MASYRDALATVFRETGVSNGGVQVYRLSEERGIACVENQAGECVSRAAFDWETVTPDMAGRPVVEALHEVKGARA